jgi:hypothetical protein
MAIKLYSDRIEIGKFTLASSGSGIEFNGRAQANKFIKTGIGGVNAGYRYGGYGDATISRFLFASTSNSTNVGSIGYPSWRVGAGGAASSTHGYAFGGSAGPSSESAIKKFPFAVSSSVPSTTVGNMPSSGGTPSHARNSEYTFYIGGTGVPTAPQGYWQRWSLASDNGSVEQQNAAGYANSNDTNSSPTNGYMAGSYSSGSSISTFPFANTNPASLTGQLTYSRYQSCGHSSRTTGFVTGGVSYGGGFHDVLSIESWPFANNGPSSYVNSLAPGNSRTNSLRNESQLNAYISGSTNSAGQAAPYTSCISFSFAQNYGFSVNNVGDMYSGNNGQGGHIQY